jgi:hypothetical protein
VACWRGGSLGAPPPERRQLIVRASHLCGSAAASGCGRSLSGGVHAGAAADRGHPGRRIGPEVARVTLPLVSIAARAPGRGSARSLASRHDLQPRRRRLIKLKEALRVDGTAPIRRSTLGNAVCLGYPHRGGMGAQARLCAFDKRG